MTTLRIDLETYSSANLPKVGVHKYVEADDFEIMLFGYKYGTGQPHVIDLAAGEEIPAHIILALYDPKILKTAYNAAFEIACLNMHLVDPLDVTQWRCTSVHALYLGMPGNLADVGKVVGLSGDKQKMSIGWSLIRYFCIPCKPTKVNGGRTRNRPQHDPAKWQLFKEYCARDIESEDAIAQKLVKFPVPDSEWKLWHLDHRMMTKGAKLDRDLVEAAIECDGIVRQRTLNEAMRLTGLDNPNSRNQLIAWLQEEEDDDTIADLTKKTVPVLLANTDSDVVRRVLELRQELAKTSVSKYHAMARAMSDVDDCVRGLTQFYGANRTGRWAGRIVQVQNLPQNKLKDIDAARRLLKTRDYETLELLFGNVPDTLSQLIRTAFIPRQGATLMPVDFSAIEARVIAWLAWCTWRLDVFKTHGKIYEASAEQMFKLTPGSVGKKSPYRQKGKIAELALGYQGGAGALKTMGALAMGLTEDELDPIKVAWREANPEIVKLWYAVEGAAQHAVANHSNEVLRIASGRAEIVFTWESGFLTIKLPSGRKLFYVKPRIEGTDLVRENSKTGAKYVVARAGSLTYEGMDQKTKTWTRLPTYGGKLCIAEGSLVLTQRGWVPIEYITPVDKVWDGVEWVNTEGAVCNGVKPVIKAYGAWMTPDHEVLSEQGWIYASQSERHIRATCGLPYGVEIPRGRWEEIFVGRSLCLRNQVDTARDRDEKAVGAGDYRVLRMQTVGEHCGEGHDARDEQAPRLRGMAINGGPMQAAFASSVAELWRAGRIRVRKMAGVVWKFLGGYGVELRLGADTGSGEQRGQLRAEQLPVGDVQNASKQPTVKVYDLVNCGPRSRFVILAGDQPLIVHNCENITQAIARDCLAESMLALDEAGFDQRFTVHDEDIIESYQPDDLKKIEAIMGRDLTWAPGLPLRADGFSTPYYMKEID